MDLYLHFGIYKTGSSFLQTNCARNRAKLDAAGYYFPDSPKDEEMIAGRITPGNGNGISNLLKEGKFTDVSRILKDWVKVAKKRGNVKILISDEALIHAFAAEGVLEKFSSIINAEGIENVYCLAFFRDPVDHCLSTFKHRAKKGTIHDFESWIEFQYETINVIQQFLERFKKVSFRWDFQKYQSNGKLMADYFFRNWMAMEDPPEYSDTLINPSLTLSELSVISAFGRSKPRLVKYVYDGLVKLPPNKKYRDKQSEAYFRSIANQFLIRKSNVIDALNVLLPEGHKLTFEESGESILREEVPVSLSRSQVDCIAGCITDAFKYSNKSRDFAKKVYRSFKMKIRK